MKLTNKFGLPAALVRAVANDDYDAGDSDITVTQLIDPPRKVALMKKHWNELEEDVSDRLWALHGQAMHAVLERSNTGETADFVETRFYTTINGWRVSGKIDLLTSTDTVVDYKYTSSWSVLHGIKDEWIEQLNCLAHLARANGISVQKLEIHCFFRDWSKLEAARNEDYPRCEFNVFDIPMWPDEQTKLWMEARVAFHRAAQSVALPECSEEERWAKQPKWAVMKKGAQKALRVLDSEALALDFIKAGKGDSIQYRPGESTRCAHYCAAAPFCDQWRQLQEEEE